MHADFGTDNACYSHFEPINRQGAEEEKAFVPCSLDQSPANSPAKSATPSQCGIMTGMPSSLHTVIALAAVHFALRKASFERAVYKGLGTRHDNRCDSAISYSRFAP
jgi:hypothetical protein